MTERFSMPRPRVIDASGNALAGAKLEFFITGTSTDKDTYTTSAKSTANANPVIADGGGLFPPIFMDTDVAYKVVLKDADDVTIWTADPVYPILPPGTFPIIAVSSKSSNYTVLETDRGADILVDASSGPVTITLLPVVTAASGFGLRVIKTDSSANVVTVDGNLAETINGSTMVELGSQYDAFEVGTDGTSWYIKSEKRLPTPAVGNADEIVAVNSAGTGFTTTTNPLPPGHLTGLTLSNNTTDATNDIDIAAGKARSDADDANLALASAVGKQLDVSWAAGGTPGAPTGGLSSSLTLTNDTWYHAFLGLVSDTGEVVFDISATGANAIADHSFTNLRRIGSVYRATATNRPFIQVNDWFLWTDPPLDVNNQTLSSSSSVNRTLSVPPDVRVEAKFNYATTTVSSSDLRLYFRTPDVDDEATSLTVAPLQSNGGQDDNAATAVSQRGTMEVITNTSRQVAERSNSSSPNIYITTLSYRDWRGRHG